MAMHTFEKIVLYSKTILKYEQETKQDKIIRKLFMYFFTIFHGNTTDEIKEHIPEQLKSWN